MFARGGSAGRSGATAGSNGFVGGDGRLGLGLALGTRGGQFDVKGNRVSEERTWRSKSAAGESCEGKDGDIHCREVA